MSEFWLGFKDAWMTLFKEIDGFKWHDLGFTIGSISMIVAIIALFFFICLYLPYLHDKRQKRLEEENPGNAYYSRGDR